MPEKHMWDKVTDDLVGWITNESDWYINAIKGSGEAPFAQPLSEQQKKEYYKTQIYKENGEPNEQGRQEVLQRIGINNYVPLLSEMEKERKGGMKTQLPEDTYSPEGDGNDVYS